MDRRDDFAEWAAKILCSVGVVIVRNVFFNQKFWLMMTLCDMFYESCSLHSFQSLYFCFSTMHFTDHFVSKLLLIKDIDYLFLLNIWNHFNVYLMPVTSSIAVSHLFEWQKNKNKVKSFWWYINSTALHLRIRLVVKPWEPPPPKLTCFIRLLWICSDIINIGSTVCLIGIF